MKYMIILAAMISLIAAKLLMDEKKYQKNLEQRLLKEWGKARTSEYSSEQMQQIAAYYYDTRQALDIDDITWNDLDMDRVFLQMNHTRSSMGQELLYSILRKPLYDGEALEKRERLISFLMQDEQKRLLLQKKLAAIGRTGKFSVYGYLSRVGELKKEHSLIHILQLFAFLAGVTLCLWKPSFFILPLAVIAVVNMVTYYRRKSEMVHFYTLFAYILRMVDFAEELGRQSIPEVERELAELSECAGSFRRFRAGSWLVVGGGSMNGSLADVLMDYVRLLTHVDIIKFHSMAREAIRLRNRLLRMYEIIGYLDAMMAVASYRSLVQSYCMPELIPSLGTDLILEADELYHPLLKEPVKNTIHTRQSILLTGSNASGKSTFIKTVAINAILAQTIHTVLADGYRANYFQILSSMALRDDIMSSESYYIVEIRSLKRILDRTKEDSAPVLCFIDEVLRGTNTLERIAASSEILRRLARSGALCFAATHDLELSELLQEEYADYHFEEQVQKEDVVFDYRLRKGKAVSRNAIKLLRMLGYDEELVEQAEKRARRFMQTGQWSRDA